MVGWWFVLSGLPWVLLCPAQKHYNTSVGDLLFPGAPPTPPPAPGSARRPLCNRRLNVPSTLIETAVWPGAGVGQREGEGVGLAVGFGGVGELP